MKDGEERLTSAVKLIELLKTLPEGAWLAANKIGNLVILDGNGEYLGYLDMASEDVHTWKDEPE